MAPDPMFVIPEIKDDRINGIISIFNAGVSFNRLLIPFMVTSFVFAGLHFANSHYFLPKSNKKRLDFERK